MSNFGFSVDDGSAFIADVSSRALPLPTLPLLPLSGAVDRALVMEQAVGA